MTMMHNTDYRKELPGIQTPARCARATKVKSSATVRRALCVLTASPTSRGLDSAVATVKQVTSCPFVDEGYSIKLYNSRCWK